MALTKEEKEYQCARVAALSVTGASQAKIAEALSMTRSAVRSIINSDEYKAYLQKSAEASLDESKAIVRSAASELAKESVRVLLKRLREDDDLDAVRIALKVMGFDKDEGPAQETQLTVILPGVEDKSINVTSEVIDEVQERES